MKAKKTKEPKQPEIELVKAIFDEKALEKEKEQIEIDRIKNTPLDWSNPQNNIYSK